MDLNKNILKKDLPCHLAYVLYKLINIGVLRAHFVPDSHVIKLYPDCNRKKVDAKFGTLALHDTKSN